MGSEVTNTSDLCCSLHRAFSPDGDPRRSKPSAFTHYNDSDEFFTSFSRLVLSAERRVSTTYIRKTPPSSFQSPAAKKYFHDAAQWMRRNPGAAFHRIIGIPSSEPHRAEMLRWLAGHRQEMQGVTRR
ncbi:hypothetical protein [Paractinoplanes rishiriensis]|uniref:Uncharacterized protein n=1 Tax=Paractinoplanes rishiriensis TaxID=1050105 RepID=A0A919JZL4_9ACTN|nr:hypothetical protein [Actinoplanes rishiriensis]GIE97618.1 hypothetical protein Ari01nite_50830 [Actinoplanes rishiriensis]